MTLIQGMRAVLRRWWIPAIIVVAAVGAVFALSPRSRAAAPQYKATAILVVNPSASQNGVNLPEAALEATVGTVPKLVAEQVGYTGNPAALAGQVQVANDPTVGTLTFEVRGPDGAHDAQLANAFATVLNQHLTQTAVNAYQAQVAAVVAHEKALQGQITQLQGHTDPISEAKLGAAEDQYRLALSQFQQLASQGTPAQTFNLLQSATPVPSGAARPPLGRAERSALAGVVGLLIGIAIAIGVDLLRPRIQDRHDAEREFGTVVLAEVPKLRRSELRTSAVHRNSQRFASFREAYRMLRTSILLMGGSEADHPEGVVSAAQQLLVSGPQVILVTSPMPGEGKSTTVANLAVAMAESGRRVLICNADFRSPQVHEAFGLEPGPGLTDLLVGDRGPAHLADVVHRTSVPGVSLVHSGSSVEDAAELVATKGARLLEEARAMADVVLLDTAPLLVVSDASELLPAVDAVVAVARAGKTTRDSARRSFELLDRAGIPVLGVALIGARSPMSYYYRGFYGYGKGYTRARRRPWRRRRDVVRVDGRRAPGNGSSAAEADRSSNGSPRSTSLTGRSD